MLRHEDVVRRLKLAGMLWETAPGITGMRGPLATLASRVSAVLRDIAIAETGNEWIVPAGIPMETLERASYFDSFPQWLTAAAHLAGDDAVLREIAFSPAPAAAARENLRATNFALSPAVCYHTYAALAGRRLATPERMTAEGVCWRQEGHRLAPLERGWAFRMREVVCLGSHEHAEEFRQRGLKEAVRLAEGLELPTEIVEASDPFFAPTARGRGLLQQIKSLKHELVFRFDDQEPLALASFNSHERFFGDAFDISLEDGTPAFSACVAYGIERWVLAILMVHGVEESGWPDLARDHSSSERGAMQW